MSAFSVLSMNHILQKLQQNYVIYLGWWSKVNDVAVSCSYISYCIHHCYCLVSDVRVFSITTFNLSKGMVNDVCTPLISDIISHTSISCRVWSTITPTISPKKQNQLNNVITNNIYTSKSYIVVVHDMGLFLYSCISPVSQK